MCAGVDSVWLRVTIKGLSNMHAMEEINENSKGFLVRSWRIFFCCLSYDKTGFAYL